MSPESQFPLENSHGRDWGSNKGADVQVLCILMLEALSLIGLSPGVSISRELGLEKERSVDGLNPGKAQVRPHCHILTACVCLYAITVQACGSLGVSQGSWFLCSIQRHELPISLDSSQ